MTTTWILQELAVIGTALAHKAVPISGEMKLKIQTNLPLRACRVAYACIRNGANPKDILQGLRLNVPVGPERDALDKLIAKVKKEKS